MEANEENNIDDNLAQDNLALDNMGVGDNNTNADANVDANTDTNVDANTDADTDTNVGANVDTNADADSAAAATDNTINAEAANTDATDTNITAAITDISANTDMDADGYMPVSTIDIDGMPSPDGMQSPDGMPLPDGMQSPDEELPPDEETNYKPRASEWIMAHKWSIAIIVIVSMIIIFVALFFAYRAYNSYKVNQDQKNNQKKLDLELCVYGVNAAGTTCKDNQCVSGQINSIYGECKELTTYCVAPKFGHGTIQYTINGKHCMRDCNYTGTSTGRYTNPVWKKSYNTKYPGVTAYMHVFRNSVSGACSTKCAPNGIADDPVYCNQKCIVTESKHTAKGACTGMGCRSGLTINKKECNQVCPSLEMTQDLANKGHLTQYQVTKGPYANAAGTHTLALYDTKVFGHSPAGKCTTTFHCGNKGITYLSKKTRNGNEGVWSCKFTQKDCPHGKFGVVSFAKVSVNGKKQTCYTDCPYGRVTLLGTEKGCNVPCTTDNCKYPTCQNTTKNGKCKKISDMTTYANNAKTLQGYHQRKAWGYQAGMTASITNSKQLHGVFTTKTHGANTLYKATYGTQHGKLGPYYCAHGVSADKKTKCNKTLKNTLYSTNITNSKTWAQTHYNKYHTKCPAGLNLTENKLAASAVCKVDCAGAILANTTTGTMRLKVAGNYKYNRVDVKCYDNLCSSNGYGICKLMKDGYCKMYGITAKHGTKCNNEANYINGSAENIQGFCISKQEQDDAVSLLGGSTYQNYYNTSLGKCVGCRNGVNYNKTSCNVPISTTKVPPSWAPSQEWQCIGFTDKGACDLNLGYIHGSGYMTRYRGRQYNAGNGSFYTGCSTSYSNSTWVGHRPTAVPGNMGTHYSWLGCHMGTGVRCYSIGIGASGNKDPVNKITPVTYNSAHCINCGFGGRTRMMSAANPTLYKERVHDYICNNNVGSWCPGHATQRGMC